jgi:hypothetical protein
MRQDTLNLKRIVLVWIEVQSCRRDTLRIAVESVEQLSYIFLQAFN